jgi:hypothetical protein
MSIMKKSFTLGEAFIAIFTLIGVMITFYSTVQVRLSSLEIRVTQMETQYSKQDGKLERIENGINEIKLQLKDKADRK